MPAKKYSKLNACFVHFGRTHIFLFIFINFICNSSLSFFHQKSSFCWCWSLRECFLEWSAEPRHTYGLHCLSLLFWFICHDITMFVEQSTDGFLFSLRNCICLPINILWFVSVICQINKHVLWQFIFVAFIWLQWHTPKGHVVDSGNEIGLA